LIRQIYWQLFSTHLSKDSIFEHANFLHIHHKWLNLIILVSKFVLNIWIDFSNSCTWKEDVVTDVSKIPMAEILLMILEVHSDASICVFPTYLKKRWLINKDNVVIKVLATLKWDFLCVYNFASKTIFKHQRICKNINCKYLSTLLQVIFTKRNLESIVILYMWYGQIIKYLK
jgi:hypothetical protein